MPEGVSQGELIYDALKAHRGNVSAVADALDMERRAVEKIINATPVLVSLKNDLRERVVDKAESNIFADVEKGDQTASFRVAQTLGKERGWTTRVDGGNRDPLEVHIRSFTPQEDPNGAGPDQNQSQP